MSSEPTKDKAEIVTPTEEKEEAEGEGSGATDGLTSAQRKALKRERKKLEKKKKGVGAAATVADDDEGKKAAARLIIEQEERKRKMMQMERLKKHVEDEHKFWDTQPVPKLTEKITEDGIGPIDKEKTVDDVPKEAMPLPAGFKWSVIDITDEKELDEVYNLLEGHYVEDDDEMFRFQYSKELLLWALQPPGWKPQWVIGVRVEKSDKMVGFITAVPGMMTLYGSKVNLAEVNFLCVHKKLRDKRLAPVLIKEVTRRVNLENIWQAAYTAGTMLPKPITSCQYYHRSLNPQKLIDVEFSSLPPKTTMKMITRLYSLPAETVTPGLRPMEERDVPVVSRLLNDKFNTLKFAPSYSEEFWGHTLLTRPNVIYSWVVEDPKTKEVTDFISFYSLPSTIIGHPKHKVLNAAYSFYHATTATPLTVLMNDVLILAKQMDYDVFNCLDLSDNKGFLKELKFLPGDGKLQYYLYNYRLPDLTPSDLGLVLV